MSEGASKSKKLQMRARLRPRLIQRVGQNDFVRDLQRLKVLKEKNQKYQRVMQRLQEKHVHNLSILEQLRTLKDFHQYVQDLGMIRLVISQHHINSQIEDTAGILIDRTSNDFSFQRQNRLMNMMRTINLERQEVERIEIQQRGIQQQERSLIPRNRDLFEQNCVTEIQIQFEGKERDQSIRVNPQNSHQQFQTQSCSSSLCDVSQSHKRSTSQSIFLQDWCSCPSCSNDMSSCQLSSEFHFQAESQPLFIYQEQSISNSAQREDQMVGQLNDLCANLFDVSIQHYNHLNCTQITTQCSQQIKFKTCLCEKCKQVKLPGYENPRRENGEILIIQYQQIQDDQL